MGSLSEKSAEREDLPDLVLLHGENDVGKSNVLKAIDAFLRLTRLYLYPESASGTLVHLGETLAISEKEWR